MKNINLFRPLFFILACLLSLSSRAQQAPNILWEHDWNNPNDTTTSSDWATDVLNVGDGTYVNVGYLGDGIGYFPSIRKVDATGKLLWAKDCSSFCAYGEGYFSQVIKNNKGNFVAVGQIKSSCNLTGYSYTIIGEWDPSGNLVKQHIFNYPGTGYVTSAGASIAQDTSSAIPCYVICGRAGKTSSTNQEVGFYMLVDTSYNSIAGPTYGISHEGDTTYGRFNHVTLAPANGLSIGSGFTVAGVENGYPDTSSIVARYKIGLLDTVSFVYERKIDCGNLPSSMSSYFKQDFNKCPSCTPSTASGNSQAEDISYIFTPSSNPTSTYILSDLFNVAHTGTTCGSETYYKDADAVLIKLTEVDTGFQITQFGNIAHFSGEDFTFKTRYYRDTFNYGDYVSIGTTQDTAFSPKKSPRGLILRSHLSSPADSAKVLWKKYLRTDTVNQVCSTCRKLSTGDMCGFGLDFAPNADTGVVDYVVCGNNANRGDDAITMLLSCDCDTRDTIKITAITSSGSWTTSPLTQTISGKITVKGTGVNETFAGSGGVPLTLNFSKPCGGIYDTGATVTLNKSVLQPVSGFQNYFSGIETDSGNVISSDTSAINYASLGIGQKTYNASLHNYVVNTTFFNCARSLSNKESGSVINTTGDLYSNCIFSFDETNEYYPIIFFPQTIHGYFNNAWPQTFDSSCVFKANYGPTNDRFAQFSPMGIFKTGGGQMQVLNCTFDTLPQGIYFTGTTYSDDIKTNVFNNIPPGSNANNNWNYGILINACSAVSIDSNTFEALAAPSTTISNASIICNKTGSAGNLIYRNLFGNSSYGAYAPTSTGILFQGGNPDMVVSCNAFHYFKATNNYAWNLVDNQVLNDQGDTLHPAGNTWADTSSPGYNISTYSGNYFKYWWNGTNANPLTLVTSGESTYITATNVSTNCSTPWSLPAGTSARMLQENPLSLARAELNSEIESLENEYNGETNEDVLRKLVAAKNRAQQIDNAIVKQYLNLNQFDSIIPFLNQSELIGDRYQLITFLLSSGRFVEARTAVNDLRNESKWKQYYNSDAARTLGENEHLNFIAFFDLMLNFQTTGKDLSQMDANSLARLYQIQKTNTPAAGLAEQVINYITDEIFRPQTVQPSNQEANASVALTAATDEHPVSVYPVPARDKVYFNVLVPNEIAAASLHITDIRGLTIADIKLATGSNLIQYPLEQLSSGLYLYTLRYNEVPQSTGKFVITK